MTLEERLKIRLPEVKNDTEIEELLLSAKDKFLELRYPVTSYPVDKNGKPIIDPRWDSWLVSAAVELYSKRGAEGQTSHSENGISRSYEAGDISSSLANKVTPVAGVIKRANT